MDNNNLNHNNNLHKYLESLFLRIVVPCILITFKILFTNKCTLY
jgi:hypothetical protein